MKKIWSLTCFIALFAAGLNAQDIGQMRFSELQGTADRLISAGRLIDADPYLDEILKRFGHVEEESDISLEVPNFLASETKLAVYQETSNRADLVRAKELLERFKTTYPSSDRIVQVVRRLGNVYAELGESDKAIETLGELLVPPLSNRVSMSVEEEVLQTLTRLFYRKTDITEGEGIYRRLLDRAQDVENRVLAASALFEALFQKNEYDEALELAPLLALESEARYRPRLNLALFRASDVFVNEERYVAASLVLNLARTTPQMRAYFEETIERLEGEAEWLRSTLSGSNRISELEREVERLKANLEAMKDLPSLESDLLVRKARNFARTGRSYEAFWLFYRLMQEYPEDSQIEFYTYAAFSQANELEKFEVAAEIGEQYARDFPDGEYAVDFEMGMAVLSHGSGEMERFEERARSFLGSYPSNANAASILALYGSSLIQAGELEKLLNEFRQLEAAHPTSAYADGIHYWMGLAYLNNRDYDSAVDRFETVLRRFSESAYVAESLFRAGVAQFAQERFVAAQETFLKFQNDFPEDPNIDQSFYFLAQISKLSNDPPSAIEYYLAGIEVTRDREMRDILHFELADLYAAIGEHDETIALLEGYLEKYEVDADHARVILAIGKAHESQRKPSEMIAIYRQGIEDITSPGPNQGLESILHRYAERLQENTELFADTVRFLRRMETDANFLREMATDPGELFNEFYENPTIDQRLYRRMRENRSLQEGLLQDIQPLVEIRETYERELDILRSENAIEFLNKHLQTAIENEDFTAEIRFQMALKQAGEDVRLSRLPEPNDYVNLAPLSLIFVSNYFADLDFSDEAAVAAQTLIANFPNDTSAIDAHRRLAKNAESNGDLEQAITHLKAIAEIFPSSSAAPVAILEQGRIHTSQGEYDLARSLYQYILRVPEWRGHLYARALFQTGESYRAEGKLAEAHGFMERVFLAYSHFGEWAARAYKADAEILIEMGEMEDARSTLREALGGVLRNAPRELVEEIRSLSESLS